MQQAIGGTAAVERMAGEPKTRNSEWALDGGGKVSAAVGETEDAVRVRMTCDLEKPVVLHWGLAGRGPGWKPVPEVWRPAATTVFDALAVRTPFAKEGGVQALAIDMPKADGVPGPFGLNFVLFQPADGRWLKSGGRDLHLPLRERERAQALSAAEIRELAQQIIDVETQSPSWTLMHRFNLCHDLLDAAQEDPDGMALLFAWLRFSQMRLLDWQRRFNTKPRELAHAQDRLTMRLAGIWKQHQPGKGPAASPECARWARSALGTLGRGGDGQRVRDEILNIMHRNHIKETHGHFMEEWHQKLHNNTTPDDVAICEAYLAFLRSGGRQDAFYGTLAAAGVTRERLRSFERPIKTDPDFRGHQKDALIGEFEHFLRILKAVHSGTDLQTAADAARRHFGGDLQREIDHILGLRWGTPDANHVVGCIASARGKLAGVLASADNPGVLRDLLFLDLGLEDFLRRTIERQPLSKLDAEPLVWLVKSTLENLATSADASEAALCARHWAKLNALPRGDREWALHARSVIDRAGRWVQTFTGNLFGRLQPKAELLGAGFGTDAAVVAMFGEEVIRGGPAFSLSLLLKALDVHLRRIAGIGGWQIVSPAETFGRVRIVPDLAGIQTATFAEPTVIIAGAIEGQEEIPPGVKAVLTCVAPDLVSHVSVRARNAHVLLAACFDEAEFKHLKEFDGRTLALRATASGDVEYEAADADPYGAAPTAAPTAPERSARPVAAPGEGRWVVSSAEFSPKLVGGKSNNLTGLRGKLPDWIRFPKSIALPFGGFERTLADAGNRALRARYDELVRTAEREPASVLEQIRGIVTKLEPPAELRPALAPAWKKAGLPEVPWEQSWTAIRKVWASKWNERAFLSRRARSVPHDELMMAVLIQEVVPADYAFVIHTINPISRNAAELFAEVVPGLGETLVGNHPGRALGFTCRKSDLHLTTVSYPGKSAGLYGGGVIFRSDSNGEDLEGFAGAGLYDSVLAAEPELRTLDYVEEKIVWDRRFREDRLGRIARAGLEIEKVLGSAQDVEGVLAGDEVFVVQTRPQVGHAVR